MFATELKDVVGQILKPGRALSLLPPAKLPEDMSWAEGNPGIADAMARWAGAIDRYARPEVPEAVQVILSDRISQWARGAYAYVTLMVRGICWFSESI